MLRWRNCDLPYLAGNLINSHSIITSLVWPGSQAVCKKELLRHFPMYIQQHKDVSELIGNIHGDIFSIIKQNGVTHDELSRTRSHREEFRDK